MSTDLHGYRREYQGGVLPPTLDEPWQLWQQWFDQALAASRRGGQVEEPTGMVLATADAQGRPSARVVLCKAFGPQGFDFYSHAGSHKGRDLAENPQAALLFHWPALFRQVRVEGEVQVRPAAAAAAYWQQRPLASQVAAVVSNQSQARDSRASLESDFAARLAAADAATGVPVPEDWRGYRLVPRRFEFWQGLSNRLHDRLELTRVDPAGAGQDSADQRWECRRLDP